MQVNNAQNGGNSREANNNGNGENKKDKGAIQQQLNFQKRVAAGALEQIRKLDRRAFSIQTFIKDASSGLGGGVTGQGKARARAQSFSLFQIAQSKQQAQQTFQSAAARANQLQAQLDA